MLPQISPSPLTSVKEPIGHPNWVCELIKARRFRGILYVDPRAGMAGVAQGEEVPSVWTAAKQVLRCVKGQRAILDDEIVVLDEKGRWNFFDLMAHRGEPRYYAFDLFWLNGIDLRSRPLLDRKQRLRRLIPQNDSHLLYVEHLEGDGARFFELACEQDLEGIICKPKTSHYPFTWIKVKNPNYSQAGGCKEWFDRMLSQR